MMLAKEENASKTCANLKEDYISLKALLTVVGVNLTELDRIKEWFPTCKTKIIDNDGVIGIIEAKKQARRLCMDTLINRQLYLE